MKSQLFFLSLAAALLLALGTVATSCGGGNEELTQALETLQVNKLDTLVLPQEELGDESANLEIDEDSGFKNNEDAAEDTIDPDDTAFAQHHLFMAAVCRGLKPATDCRLCGAYSHLSNSVAPLFAVDRLEIRGPVKTFSYY